jgi:hypothetical protein
VRTAEYCERRSFQLEVHQSDDRACEKAGRAEWTQSLMDVKPDRGVHVPAQTHGQAGRGRFHQYFENDIAMVDERLGAWALCRVMSVRS